MIKGAWQGFVSHKTSNKLFMSLSKILWKDILHKLRSADYVLEIRVNMLNTKLRSPANEETGSCVKLIFFHPIQ